MFTIIGTPASICWTPFTISEIDIKYVPAVIFPVLFSRNFTFIEDFYTKISKFPNKFKQLVPLPNRQSKSNLSQRPGDLNNDQVTDIRDIHDHCIPLDVPYLLSPWQWMTWNTLIIV